jgi:spore coat polysaccharide biosynthesis predicted glycosyltransferase SpsG
MGMSDSLPAKDHLQICASLAYGGTKGGGHLARVRYFLERLSQYCTIHLTIVVDHESINLIHAKESIPWESGIKCRYCLADEVCQGENREGKSCIYDLLIIDRTHESILISHLAACCQRIMVIADGAENPYVSIADLLIDFNYGAEHALHSYRSYARPECKLLLGWAYAPIGCTMSHDLQVDERSKRLDMPLHILIAMGTEDPLYFTEQALAALVDAKLAEQLSCVTAIEGPLFNRVIGRDYPFPMTVIKAPPSLQPYYEKADLCIATGGVSTWERLKAHLPSRIVAYSNLQMTILQPLHAAGLIELYPDFPSLCNASLQPSRLKDQLAKMDTITLGSRVNAVISSILQ